MNKPEQFKEGDKVGAVDADGSLVTGILKRQDVIDMEWYVDYEDGESCLVLDWQQLTKIKESE